MKKIWEGLGVVFTGMMNFIMIPLLFTLLFIDLLALVLSIYALAVPQVILFFFLAIVIAQILL